MRIRQIAARLRLRILRLAVQHRPGYFERRWTLQAHASVPGWPDTFRPLDIGRFDSRERAAEIERYEFDLLSHLARLDGDWQNVCGTQLWRFHLHYWDWCWHLANQRTPADLTATATRMYADWASSTVYGKLDAWAPYVVALRLWTWCGIHGRLVCGSPIKRTLENEIRRHAGFLRANLETDVGGNHLLKNLKAMIGAAVFLGDEHLLDEFTAMLGGQLSVQILADGGHYELSPSYHAQVLGDLLDVRELLQTTGSALPDHFDETVAGMRSWLSAFVGPDGEVPVFNDAFAIDADELDRIGVPAPADERLVVLKPSGYVIVRPRPDVQIVIDVGHPCPPELPAHAHADCLSFELVIGGDRVIVDTGTSEYGSTERRRFERSTAAHNTVEVDGINQTDVWGAFRAGRRARPTLLDAATISDDAAIIVEAKHDGYRYLGGQPMHRRRFEISADGMVITDTITGGGRHRVASRLLFGSALAQLDKCSARTVGDGGNDVTVGGDHDVIVDSTLQHARDFGALQPASGISMSTTSDLPVELRWKMNWS